MYGDTHSHTHNIYIIYCFVERYIQKLSGGFMLMINWFVNGKVALNRKKLLKASVYKFKIN